MSWLHVFDSWPSPPQRCSAGALPSCKKGFYPPLPLFSADGGYLKSTRVSQYQHQAQKTWSTGSQHTWMSCICVGSNGLVVLEQHHHCCYGCQQYGKPKPWQTLHFSWQRCRCCVLLVTKQSTFSWTKPFACFTLLSPGWPLQISELIWFCPLQRDKSFFPVGFQTGPTTIAKTVKSFHLVSKLGKNQGTMEWLFRLVWVNADDGYGSTRRKKGQKEG